MSNSQVKRIIITGAGFSAPAHFPTQNRIVDDMIAKPSVDFVFGEAPLESLKFMDALITVGLFLLNHYGESTYLDLQSEYSRLIETRQIREYIETCKRNPALTPASDWIDVDKTYSAMLQILPRSDDEYATLYTLRNKITTAINDEKISINLEDVFTSFDKSVRSSEYVHKYTYLQMDVIRYSIMRLFSYYFSKSILEHDFAQVDYLNFIRFIKSRRANKPLSIITTNWDTLLEGYLQRNRIEYDYGFQSPYTSNCNEKDLLQNKLRLLKIHGSANWLRCLHCGAVTVFSNNKAADSLFSDDEYESCSICGTGNDSREPSLQPEIITPTMIKALTNRLYANLWGCASSEIRNATHVIFIGYSLPMADFDFRYMLQRNMPTDAEIDVVLYEDVNPKNTDNDVYKDLLPEKRYKDTFPKNRTTFHYGGFKEFFSSDRMR